MAQLHHRTETLTDRCGVAVHPTALHFLTLRSVARYVEPHS